MSESMKKVLQPLIALPPAKRWAVAGVAALSIISFAILIMIANRTDYRPLFTNLTSEDAGEIVKKLKEQKIPHQIGADGKSIMVPSDKVYDLRLTMASEGLPQGGGVGFEIFDRKNFGMTEFVQKLNYQRALQGELSRTISQLSGVEQARVHLAIPEKSIFKEGEKPPTASVVLKMKSSRALSENEIQGVVHLVASAVDGMDPGNVSVLDSRGKMLNKAAESDVGNKLTTTMMETQRTYEKNLEDRLQTLLDKAVGAGRSVARVNAVFDFKQVERYEEKYDPESPVVRSEQRTEEQNDSGAVQPAGVPGVQSNLAKTAPATTPTKNSGSRSDETMNYEISRSTARIVEPVGTLSKVSVAVMVDGKYDAAGKTAAAKPKYVPRTPDELQKIESLVKSAVGFNAERGDQLTVANVPFQDSMQDSEESENKWWNAPILHSVLKNGLIGISFLALLFLVIRPMMKMLKPAATPAGSESFVPLEDQEEKRIAAANRAQLAMQSVNQLELTNQVKGDPYQAAQILQNWLRQKE